MKTEKKHIAFTKMQAAGNDFVLIDNRQAGLSEEEIIQITPELCDRKFGVGSDGILVLMEAKIPECDYTMFYRNPDGSDAGMCGNGARCMAKFAQSLNFGKKQRFNVHDNIYQAEIDDIGSVRIYFDDIETSVKPHEICEGQPDGDFEIRRQKSPPARTRKFGEVDEGSGLEKKGAFQNRIYIIHTGTEHIVKQVEDETLSNEDWLRSQGRQLRHHSYFQPKGTNVNFVFGVKDDLVKLQTYERGVENLTLACGTGAVASALVWHHIRNKKSSQDENEIRVQTKGGELRVGFAFDSNLNTYSNIYLEGPAKFVFTGEYGS